MLGIQGHWHPKDYGPLEMTHEKEVSRQLNLFVTRIMIKCSQNPEKDLISTAE